MEQKPQLNTEKHEHITYNTEELGFTILGGIRLDGLDRMRVTLKIEAINRKFEHYINNPEIANLAIRHNIDLYNDTQVEKLIRKTADKLEVGTTSIATSIADITNQLENYRLQKIEEQEKVQDKKKVLTEEEYNQAKAFLTSNTSLPFGEVGGASLMQRTSQAIEQSGLIGEKNNALLMYTIFTSRKREHPLHIVSLGNSGIGKTYLQEKVSELIPDEEKEEITSLSENAFYYFGKTELKNKLILIEDLDGALSSLFPLRELQSKKRITKRISIKDNKGNTKTISVTVEGPICVAGCTTHETIYEDNANRSFLIYLDESKEQDERIMQRQRAQSAGIINIAEENKIKVHMQNCQRILQPISVRNPFAEKLKLPTEVFKPRRSNSHYLQFIEAITFYHQYQRTQQVDETTGEIYIETTLEDIEEANKLIKEILLRKSDELNTACRRHFEYIKAHLKTESKLSFTRKEIRQALRIDPSSQKRYMLKLVQNNYIKKVDDKKTKGHVYEVVSYEEYETLKNSISSVLDEILQQLQQDSKKINASGGSPQKNLPVQKKLNSSTTVHDNSEPIKPTNRKEKKATVQKFTESNNSIEK